MLSCLLAKAWAKQFNEGGLASHMDRDTLGLIDILRFLLMFVRRHRAAGKMASKMCVGKLDMWRQALVAWIAKVADKTVLELYLDNDVSKDMAPPAIRFKTEGKRKYTFVAPQAKWDILEDAREIRTLPSTVVAVRSKMDEFGCHANTAEGWMRKEQEMYWKRTGIGLSCGASHASYTFYDYPLYKLDSSHKAHFE